MNVILMLIVFVLYIIFFLIYKENMKRMRFVRESWLETEKMLLKAARSERETWLEAEIIRLKEKLLKGKAGRSTLKDNLAKYREENKKLGEAARKKRKERSDAGKRRDVPENGWWKGNRGKPKGAKGGGLKNPAPHEIDRILDHYLESCPRCKESLKNVNPCESPVHYIRDFEHVRRGIRLVIVKHVVHRYRCPGCHEVVSKRFGKLKYARYGIGMIAFVLRERLGRSGSWEGIRSTMEHITHSNKYIPTVAACINWIKKYESEMKVVHDAFVEVIKDSPFVHVDETGLPMSGRNWWLWVLVAAEVVLYLPSKSRGSDTVKDIFCDYKGVLLSDFWSAYNKFDVEQQKCLVHLVRELRKLLMVELKARDKASATLTKDDDLKARKTEADANKPKKRGPPPKQPDPLSSDTRSKLEAEISRHEKAVRQLLKLCDFFKKAWTRDGSDMSVYTPLEGRISISEALSLLDALIQEIKGDGPANVDINRLIKRLEKFRASLFTYLENPDVPPDNNAAERQLRPFVVQRKDSGNFVSPEVMKTYADFMSLYRTCKKNGVNCEAIFTSLLNGDTDAVLYLLGLIEAEPPPANACS